eukprot:1149509-Pelagomonas_calceolata.AAC.8
MHAARPDCQAVLTRPWRPGPSHQDPDHRKPNHQDPCHTDKGILTQAIRTQAIVTHLDDDTVIRCVQVQVLSPACQRRHTIMVRRHQHSTQHSLQGKHGQAGRRMAMSTQVEQLLCSKASFKAQSSSGNHARAHGNSCDRCTLGF